LEYIFKILPLLELFRVLFGTLLLKAVFSKVPVTALARLHRRHPKIRLLIQELFPELNQGLNHGRTFNCILGGAINLQT
jgi:hypothetical protein